MGSVKKSKKTIGILTGGGDVPGLNPSPLPETTNPDPPPQQPPA